jgi:hypothetical protein
MFAPLLGAVRADIDRQIGWAKDEVRRQTRHTVQVGVLAGVAALAALGAIVVGLIALYFWLATLASPFAALGVMGGCLLLIALILLALVLAAQRPAVAPRPQLQIARPTALLGTLRQGEYGKVVADSEPTQSIVTDAMRHGSRSGLVSALVLIAVAGLIASRRLNRVGGPP